MTRLQLIKIKKEYEKGNKIPFIRSARKEVIIDEDTGLLRLPEDDEVYKWWASKLIEYNVVQYNVRNKLYLFGRTVQKYTIDRFPWDWLIKAEYRLSDETISWLLSDRETKDELTKYMNMANASGAYFMMLCRDNKEIAAIIDKNRQPSAQDVVKYLPYTYNKED